MEKVHLGQIFDFDTDLKGYTSLLPYALIILNHPIPQPLPKSLVKLWENADLLVCADGGANRLYDALGSTSKRHAYMPDLICGDLDSLREDVAFFYRSREVAIKRAFNQNSTDFMKCMREAISIVPTIQTIFGWGALSGRFDHVLHSMHLLHVMPSFRENPPLHLFLVDEENMVFLCKGETQIYAPRRYFGPSCGIACLVGAANLTTQGLRWNVENWKLEMGHQVTTSNQLLRDMIVIETDKPVVFTLEIRRVWDL